MSWNFWYKKKSEQGSFSVRESNVDWIELRLLWLILFLVCVRLTGSSSVKQGWTWNVGKSIKFWDFGFLFRFLHTLLKMGRRESVEIAHVTKTSAYLVKFAITYFNEGRRMRSFQQERMESVTKFQFCDTLKICFIPVTRGIQLDSESSH